MISWKCVENICIEQLKNNMNNIASVCTYVFFYNDDGENEKFIWIPLSKIKTIPWAFGTGNKIKEILNKVNMAKKNTIKLTESELKKIISESVRRTLNEISSDYVHRAYQSALDKRNKAIFTPEYGKRNKQVDKFRDYYRNAYNNEHGYDGRTEGGDTFSLQFNDTLSNGSPLRVYVNLNDICLKSQYFDNTTDIAKLIKSPNYQKQFCILSPKTAQQVAQWFSKNRNPNYAQYTEEACNPEFWSQYYNITKFNDDGSFSRVQNY